MLGSLGECCKTKEAGLGLRREGGVDVVVELGQRGSVGGWMGGSGRVGWLGRSEGGRELS